MESIDDYNVVNGTAYHKDTPTEVIEWLETSRERQQRIRIFYGDRETGLDWKEVYDTMGIVGRRTGSIKIPILIRNMRSNGGGAILDNCIVRITTYDSQGKIRVVYSAENYKLCNESIGFKDNPDAYNGLTYELYIDSEFFMAFDSKEKRNNFLNFLKGKRNRL